MFFVGKTTGIHWVAARGSFGQCLQKNFLQVYEIRRMAFAAAYAS
jgi:hypothetical protein